MQRWTISQTQDNTNHAAAPGAFRLEFAVPPDDDFRVLLLSDEHHDNILCDREMLMEHLEEAKRVNAPTFHIGDTFCAMQGKYDPRADKSQLRKELQGNDYFDQLINEAEKFYKPYAQQFALLFRGNHELSIKKHYQTDLCARLAKRLQSHESPVLLCGMGGFVRLAAQSTRKALAVNMWCHHGYGGGGEVTRGMIDNSRTRSQVEAEIFASGHIHRVNVDNNIIVRLSKAGTVEKRKQKFVRLGAYTDEELSEWQIARGQFARPKGGWWLKLRLSRRGGVDRLEYRTEEAA